MNKKLVLAFLFSGLSLPAFAAVAVDHEQLIAGTGCPATGQNAGDWDAFAECPSASGTWARGPLFVGSTSDSCDSSHAGMVQWTGSLIEYCNGGAWVSYGSSGASVALSGLTAATAGLTIDNGTTGAYPQTWTWNSLTTQNAFTLSSTSMTSGSILAVTGANTALTGNVLNVTTASTGKASAINATVSGASNTGSAGYFTNASTSGYSIYAPGTSPNYFGGNVTIASGKTYQIGGNIVFSDPKSDTNSVAAGLGAGISQTGSSSDTYAGYNAGTSVTTASNVVAIGANSLHSLVSGANCVAIGASAFYSDASTCPITGLGYQAGYYVVAADNTAMGYQAMKSVSGSGVSVTTDTAVGNSAYFAANTTAANNTAVGYKSLYSTTSATPIDTTAVGDQALNGVTTGSLNSALGYQAGLHITTGGNNLMIGYQAMQGSAGSPLTGTANVAVGYQALFSGQAGLANSTAVGYQAAYSDTNFSDQAAMGYQALYSNNGVTFNSAFGYQALYNSTASGSTDEAFGYQAAYNVTTAANNEAFGYQALMGSSTSTPPASQNIAIGYQALASDQAQGNTAVGYQAGYAGTANTNGSNNTFIGYQAQANGAGYTNGTAIGSSAILTASNSIVLGNSSITKIYSEVTSITAISDRRLKTGISDLSDDLGLTFIDKLRPVSYRFKDGDETQRHGIIAQELEQALPQPLQNTVETAQHEHGLALIERQNDKDRTYRVAYGELIAPLVKAVQTQQTQIAANHDAIAHLASPDTARADEIRDIETRLHSLRLHLLLFPLLAGGISLCLGFFLAHRKKRVQEKVGL